MVRDDAGREERWPTEREAARSHPRVVLYTCVGVALVVAVAIGVLASTVGTRASDARSPLIGRSAPVVQGRYLASSGSAALAQYSGRWVLLNFSASSCVPCREETPQLLLFQTEHEKRHDATVLSVEFDPYDTADLAAFLKRSGATWPAIVDDEAEVSYGVTGIPDSFLIDPQGTVIATFVGGVTADQVDGVISKAT